jgi:alpha-tubulin suppressor-like RCC1 family protein
MNTIFNSKKIFLISFFIIANINIIYSQCFSKISVSNTHSLAIKTDGTLWAWGSNSYGELGDGTSVSNRTIPTQIGNATNWLSISAGDGYYSIALKTDGTLWAWGRNNYGQLGDGTNINKNIPIQIGTENNWSKIATGNSFTIAIKSNGSLWTWGNNSYTLGNGTTQTSSIPINIGTTTPYWIKIDAYGSNAAVLSGINSTFIYGALVNWGNNTYGQLGLNSTINKTSPSFVEGSWAANWAEFKVGDAHSVAIKNNGTLWSWGRGLYGQLGNGNTSDVLIPTQIGTENNWLKIASSNSRTYAIKTDGTLWGWGRNGFGGTGYYLLGDGSFLDKYSPIQIGTDNSWVEISSKGKHTLAIKANGSLWAWGDNLYGQLGDGSNTTRTTPVNITCPNTLSSNNSIDEINIKNTFPNPVKDNLYITNNESLQLENNIEIYDLQGRLIYQTRATIDNNNLVINMSNLTSGLYFIQLKSKIGGKKIRTIKVIKE